MNNVLEMVQSESILSRNDISYLMYETENKEDYLVMNYIQTTVVNKFGKMFIEKSKDKIGFVLSILLKDDVNLMYDFYIKTSSYYLKENKDIAPFNLIFLTYIHFAMKVLRSNS